MPLPVETRPCKHPVNVMLRETVLAAFSFLLAIEIRDVLAKIVATCLPNNTGERLIVSIFIVLVIALMTLLVVTYWQPME